MNATHKVAAAIFCLLVLMGSRPVSGAEETRRMILKVYYIPVEGTDVEYGQGAIERNELAHSVLGASTWLIRVAAPGDPRWWEAKLNASVDRHHGSFRVEQPTAEELRGVESGEITFQE